MNKKIKYLLMFFICFGIFSTNVNAISFHWNKRIYFKKNLGFSSSKSSTYNHGSLIKKYSNADIKGASNSGYAYCADRAKDFKTGTAYVKDTTYETAKCYYEQYNKNEQKWKKTSSASGDCSKIIGYIIKKGKEKGNTELKDYGYVQSAIWVFLGRYSTIPAWKTANAKNVNYAYNNNSTIRTILRSAFKEYDAAKSSGSVVTKTEQDHLFEVSGNDGKFYFIPNYNVCGTTGVKYQTKTMTVKNPSKTESITINFEPQSTGFNIIIKDQNGEKTCDSTGCSIELKGNKSIEFYLKIDGNKNIGKVDLIINAEKKGPTTTTTTDGKIYDSVKYKRKSTGLQGLIIQTVKDIKDKSTATTILYDKQTLTFNQDIVTSSTPKDTTSEKETTSVCANLAQNYNETHAELSATACRKVTLDDGSVVRTILSETVSFDYGYLFPSNYDSSTNKLPIVYSGGSFKFNTDDTLGVTSKYSVKIGWEFADYKGTTPYYYNENSTDTDASKRIAEINKELVEYIKTKLENLNLNIDTLDSNYLDDSGNGKAATYEYKISLSDDSQKIIYNNSEGSQLEFKNNNGKYELSIDIIGIEPKKYKMKNDGNGIVEYLNHDSEEYTNEEYKRAYFVPMYYPDGKFKFNIAKTNLSLVEGITLEYKGTCNIGVQNQFNQESLRYRSISVNNPFPKANTDTGENMPSNWKDWYVNNTKNQERIANTYKNQFIYHINLTNDKIKKIDEINSKSAYTDWTNINTSTGTSSVIVGGEYSLFDTRASNNSYCKIGEFKDECDK